jgi:hypothetical protein
VTGAACKTPGPAGDASGVRFLAPPAEAPLVPLEAMFDVCWPPTAGASERVRLLPAGSDVSFEVEGGASNSVGWCLREIATSVPEALRVRAPLTVAPPVRPVDLWAALAWVKLLAAGRFDARRGLLDPAPLAAACVAKGVHPGLVQVEQVPILVVRGLPPFEAERCLEAVLGSTAWPAPKSLTMTIGPPPKGLVGRGDVSHYVSPDVASGAALDPSVVRETLRAAVGEVGACWNEALLRRAGLGGSRTLRFRTDDAGRVVHAWVGTPLSEGPVAADYLLDACLASVVRERTFAGARGDGLYTWVFATR